MRVRLILALGGFVAVAACVPRSQPPPPPQQPQQRPAPQPLPPPPPASADWRDIPRTGGDWVYRGDAQNMQALFGVPASEAQFIVRCDRARRQIMLSREGAPSAATMTIRTSTSARTVPVTIRREPLAYATATLSAGDPILDAMVFSRGRFTVEAPGLPMLVLPTWPAPARVIEDCRG